MKKRAGYLGSAAINLIANATASILSAATILIVIRALSISDWGRTAALLGTGQLLGSVLSFGTPARLIRELSTLRVAAYRRHAYALTLVRSLTGLSILFLGLLILTTSSPDAGSVVILAAGVFVSLGSTVGFISRRRYVVAAAVLLTEKTAALVTLIVLAGVHSLTPTVFCGVLGASGIMAGLLASTLLRRGHTNLRVLMTAARRQWLGSLHFGIAAVAPSFLLLDTVIVAHVCGASEAGAYAVGSRLLAPLSFVSTTLAQTLMPVLAIHGPGARISLPTPRRWILGVGVVASVVSILITMAPGLAVWTLGTEYSAAAWPIRFFILNAAAVLVTRALATALQAWRYESLVSILVGASVLIALLGVFLGAAIAGAGAAASGVFAANIILALALAAATYKIRRRSLAAIDCEDSKSPPIPRLR